MVHVACDKGEWCDSTEVVKVKAKVGSLEDDSVNLNSGLVSKKSELGTSCGDTTNGGVCTDGCDICMACVTDSEAGTSLCIYGLVSPICGEI